MQLTLLTALTMLAFAANSVLCRMALAGASIDAANVPHPVSTALSAPDFANKK